MDIIEKIIAAKPGNKEFVLGHRGSSDWYAAIGNKSSSMSIGECLSYGEDGVEFFANGQSSDDALCKLLAAIVSI